MSGTIRTQVEAFLVQQRPRPVCVKCLVSALSRRGSAIHRAVTMLEGAPNVIRERIGCSLCGKLRLVVRVR